MKVSCFLLIQASAKKKAKKEQGKERNEKEQYCTRYVVVGEKSVFFVLLGGVANNSISDGTRAQRGGS